MRPYLAILSARFRTLLQYRAAAAAGFGTQLFWGLIRVMIFAGFYQSSSKHQPLSYQEVVTYVWLSQAMLVMLPYNLDQEIQAMIRSGSVAYELLRPVDLYSLWYCRAIAMRTAPALLRAIPMFITAGLFFGLTPPPSAASAAAWASSIIAAVILSSAITTLLSISLLWTVSGEGIARLVSLCSWVLSGMIVPLPLFPDWMQRILDLLPFRGVVDIPFRLYLGNIPPQNAFIMISQQLIWAASLILLGRLILSRGVRRMVVQGG